MSDKQAALEAIRKLPDEVSFREIREEIEFLAAVREGEAQADQGRLIPLEQVEKNLPSWLSKSS
jgi:predicted transcriptional regulator